LAGHGTPPARDQALPPRLRRGLVTRQRLIERLGRGAESTLTLISAPAGFGKTTLLAAWLAAAPARERSTAWLSLDPDENDAASFWAHTGRDGSYCEDGPDLVTLAMNGWGDDIAALAARRSTATAVVVLEPRPAGVTAGPRFKSDRRKRSGGQHTDRDHRRPAGDLQVT